MASRAALMAPPKRWGRRWLGIAALSATCTPAPRGATLYSVATAASGSAAGDARGAGDAATADHVWESDAVSGGMVRVPPGRFVMGSDWGAADERPAREFEMAAFEIDRTEVTVRAYAACVAASACDAPGVDTYCNWPKRTARGEHPINCISWDAAAAFCTWAGKRLPSEVEWEYAARGPEGRRYPWGDAVPALHACWDGARSEGGMGARRSTCTVGTHAEGRSAFGADDMAGNVLEWTRDAYAPSYVAAPNDALRVNRGGSWVTFEGRDLRAALRFRSTRTRRDFTIGFRCAR